MFTTVAPLGIAFGISRLHFRSSEQIRVLRRTPDSIGDNLPFMLLRKMLKFDKPQRLTEEADCGFKGLIFTEGAGAYRRCGVSLTLCCFVVYSTR